LVKILVKILKARHVLGDAKKPSLAFSILWQASGESHALLYYNKSSGIDLLYN